MTLWCIFTSNAKSYINMFYNEFYRVVWTINALLTVPSKMLPFWGNNQNIKIVQSPREHFAIGYVHNDNLSLGNIALQYVIPNNFRKVWWCFLMISCTFWRWRKNLSNSPKLSCGFKLLHRVYLPLLDTVCIHHSPNIQCNLIKHYIWLHSM